MPTYQYACHDCGNHFEKRQGFSDAPLTICPACQGAVERVISPVGVIFKGSGFYINDSKSGNNNGAGSKSSSISTALPPSKSTPEAIPSANSASENGSTTAGSD